jgi:hypothetical protein
LVKKVAVCEQKKVKSEGGGEGCPDRMSLDDRDRILSQRSYVAVRRSHLLVITFQSGGSFSPLSRTCIFFLRMPCRLYQRADIESSGLQPWALCKSCHDIEQGTRL